MTGERDLLALEDTVCVTVEGVSGFSWQRSHKLRWEKKKKKKEGNVAVQLYKVAVGAGHSRVICDCHGSLLPLIAWNKAPPWLTQAGHRRSRVWRDTRWQCFQKDALELRGAEDSQLWHLVGTLGKGLCPARCLRGHQQRSLRVSGGLV